MLPEIFAEIKKQVWQPCTTGSGRDDSQKGQGASQRRWMDHTKATMAVGHRDECLKVTHIPDSFLMKIL